MGFILTLLQVIQSQQGEEKPWELALPNNLQINGSLFLPKRKGIPFNLGDMSPVDVLKSEVEKKML